MPEIKIKIRDKRRRRHGEYHLRQQRLHGGVGPGRGMDALRHQDHAGEPGGRHLSGRGIHRQYGGSAGAQHAGVGVRGMYAGDLHTSRAADLRVLPSVTTPGGAPAARPKACTIS